MMFFLEYNFKHISQKKKQINMKTLKTKLFTDRKLKHITTFGH